MSIASNERDLSRIVTAIQQIEQGRLNVTGRCVLQANSDTTSVAAMNCGAQSIVVPIAMSAAAAAEIASGNFFVQSVSNGSFVLKHTNSASTDRVFGFVCIG